MEQVVALVIKGKVGLWTQLEGRGDGRGHTYGVSGRELSKQTLRLLP